MELNIPGIHGVGDSRIYFVDRYRDFSIYDVDFVPIPGVDQHPPALAGMHWFGVVQTSGDERSADWTDFYHELLGFTVLPGGQYFGILPKGTLLAEPVRQVLSAADRAAAGRRGHRAGRSSCCASGSARRTSRGDRGAARRGIVFVDREPCSPSDKGALTQIYLGGVTFELVQSDRRRLRRTPRGAA